MNPARPSPSRRGSSLVPALALALRTTKPQRGAAITAERIYRLRKGHLAWALACMLVCGLLAGVCLVSFLRDPDASVSGFVVGELIWGGFFLLALLLLLSTQWTWLERQGSCLTWQRLLGRSSCDLARAQVSWEKFPPGGRIVLRDDEGRRLQLVLDNFSHEDRAELIRLVLERVPAARQAPGFEAFRQKFASWLGSSGAS